MKSFLQGRPVHDTNSLQSLAGQKSEALNKARQSQARACAVPAANVECIREGDKVVRMIVTCSCGERIRIECLYPPGG